MIAAMLLQLADPAALAIDRAAQRLSVATADPAPRERYRIADDDGAGIDPIAAGKDRALAETGTRCQVVGARMCTRKPRTIFSTGWP